MDKQKRLIQPVGHIITELRKRKGWNIADLAHASGLDEKTVGAAEDGVRKYPSTLRRIADALDEDVATILGEQVVNKPAEPLSIVIRFELSTDNTPYSGAEAAQLLCTALEQAVSALRSITPISTRPGSVILVCTMYPTDFLRVIAAFMEGSLDDPLEVSDIWILGYRLPYTHNAVLHTLLQGWAANQIYTRLRLDRDETFAIIRELGARYSLNNKSPELLPVFERLGLSEDKYNNDQLSGFFKVK